MDVGIVIIREQEGHGEVGIGMGVLHDGHCRVGGLAEVEEWRYIGIDCVPKGARYDLVAGVILEEEARALGKFDAVLKPVIVWYS